MELINIKIRVRPLTTCALSFVFTSISRPRGRFWDPGPLRSLPDAGSLRFWRPLGAPRLDFCDFSTAFNAIEKTSIFRYGPKSRKSTMKSTLCKWLNDLHQNLTTLNDHLAENMRFLVPLRISRGAKIRSGSAEGPSRACQHGFRHSLFPYLGLHPTSHHLFFMLSHWVSVSAGALR